MIASQRIACAVQHTIIKHGDVRWWNPFECVTSDDSFGRIIIEFEQTPRNTKIIRMLISHYVRIQLRKTESIEEPY